MYVKDFISPELSRGNCWNCEVFFLAFVFRYMRIFQETSPNNTRNVYWFSQFNFCLIILNFKGMKFQEYVQIETWRKDCVNDQRTIFKFPTSKFFLLFSFKKKVLISWKFSTSVFWWIYTFLDVLNTIRLFLENVCLYVCDKNFVASVARELMNRISWNFMFSITST